MLEWHGYTKEERMTAMQEDDTIYSKDFRNLKKKENQDFGKKSGKSGS